MILDAYLALEDLAFQARLPALIAALELVELLGVGTLDLDLYELFGELVLAGGTLDGVCAIFSAGRTTTAFVVLVVHLFINHGLIWQFYLVFASLWSSLASLPKRQRIRTLLTFKMMVIVLSLVLASLRPALASLHESIHGSFELNSGLFLELHGLLHDSLLIFAALGPAPASMFLIIIIGRFLIILFNSLLMRLMKIA